MKNLKKSITGYEPEILMVQASSIPVSIISMACDITMKSDFKLKKFIDQKEYSALCKKLLEMNHTSIFEHVHYTFFIKNITRSLLAQLTRHRIGSFTSGSQHYQEYDSHYGFSISKRYSSNVLVIQAIQQCIESYRLLRQAKVPKEEARQVLPNAIHVNLLWSVNARSLINFLNLRLCARNVLEMKIFAQEIHELVKKHFPELFDYVGSDCFMTKCKQGGMSCTKNVSKYK